nr:hypothetical protein [Tanacetum cinerariifolium]
MDLLAFIHVADPTKVRVVEREPRAESELEANVNKLSDEGGKTEEDHIASIEVATGGKSPSVLNELLASSLLNVEAGVKAMATLTFITFSVSATLKREDYNPTDSVTGTNLRTIGPAERLVISPDSSHQSSTYAFGAEVASIIRSAIPLSLITEAVITTATVGIPFAPIPKTSDKVNIPVHASMFHDLDFVRTVKPDVAGPSHLPRKELSFGSREVDSEHLHEIRDMDYEQLFIEFNVGTTRQVCLNAEVRMRTEYCLSERKRLELECVNQANLLKAKDDEVERLKAQLLLKEAEAAETIRIRSQVSATEATEKIHADEIEPLKQRNVALETKKNSLDEKVTELQSSVSTKDLELKDLNAALSSLRSQNNGLVDQLHALEATCFGLCGKVGCKSYGDGLSFRGEVLSPSIDHYIRPEDGLAAKIDHGREGRSLTDIAAYNPFAEADFNSALQELREIDFALLAELKSHKDASVEDIMNLLRLEVPLADAPGMGDLQPDIEYLNVPIHRSEDQVVLRETSLSFDLSVSHSRVEQIKENIAAERSTLLDVWTPLSEPLSVQNLIGKATTSASVPAATVTTTALSTTFASISSIPPIIVDDYEIVHADGQESSQGNVQGDAATVEFEKEDLDTTPEHDLPS